MLTKGIDVSNYSGNITAPVFAAAKEKYGIEFVVCGTQNPEITRYQVDSAKSAGLEVELYTYLYYDYHDDARIAKAIEIAKQFGLSRIWVDVETSEQFPPGDEPKLPVIVRSLSKIVENGINSGVYTNGHYWNEMTDEFEDVAKAGFPLFIASWVYNRDITEKDFEEYETAWPQFGGWTQPHTWQYAADVNLDTERGNLHCDLCVRYIGEIQAPEVPEVPVNSDPTESEGWYQECLLVAHAMHVGYLAYYKQEWSNLHSLDRSKLYQFARWVVLNVEGDNRES